MVERGYHRAGCREGAPTGTTSTIIEIPIQINGKMKSKITVPAGSTSEMVREIALLDPKIKSILSGATIRKEVIVDGKLVNFVI